jgi:cytochrome c peroxidase
MKKITLAASLLGIVIVTVAFAIERRTTWTPDELSTLSDLSIDALGPLPADPTNKHADDARAAALGRQIFFDTRFSANGKVSCASCHQPDRQFQDDRALSRGVGTTGRRAMPIVGTAYSPWFFWDGRKDSQWSQALGPLESPVEHGGRRGEYVKIIAREYDAAYRNVFGGSYNDTTRVFANIGKAIAAYERTLQFGDSRYDQYVRTGRGLSADEIAGLKLFIGKAECTQCHSGPLLTDNSFHNIGIESSDAGRSVGVQQVLADEFNCRSKFSDANHAACSELEFVDATSVELVGAFKTPSLRNVSLRPPYMHAGQLETLEEVVDHYNRAPAAAIGRTELKPLELTKREQRQLVAFLRALQSPIVEQRTIK